MKQLTEMRGSRICSINFGTTASPAKVKVMERFSGIGEHGAVTVTDSMLNSFGRPTHGIFSLSGFPYLFLISPNLDRVDVMTDILMHLCDWLPSSDMLASVETTGDRLDCWLSWGDIVVALLSSSSGTVGFWSLDLEGNIGSFFLTICIPACTHWANRQALWKLYFNSILQGLIIILTCTVFEWIYWSGNCQEDGSSFSLWLWPCGGRTLYMSGRWLLHIAWHA